MNRKLLIGGAATVLIAGGMVELYSADLRQHLLKWESGTEMVLTAYADSLAGGLPSVCNGLTRHVTTTPIVVGDRWTVEQCLTEQHIAVTRLQLRLAQCFKHTPPQAVFDMATSHGWNLGVENTCGSGAMQAWNRQEWERGCRRLSRGDDGRIVWSYVSKVVNGIKQYTLVQGLVNRRNDETATCLEGLT